MLMTRIMQNNSMRYIGGLLFVMFLMTSLLVATTGAQGAFGGSKEEACKGAALDDQGKCNGEASKTLDNTLKNVINVFSVIVSIAAVIMIIVGGLRYVLSGGDSGRVGSAKNTIIFALVGLLFVAIAQIIVRFVLNTATSGVTPEES